MDASELSEPPIGAAWIAVGKLHALVDIDDLPRVAVRRWNVSPAGYAVAGRAGCLYMHRVVMGAQKGQQVDHVDGNKLDNRRANLRICTNSENRRNQKIRKDSSHNFKGVERRTKGFRTRFYARIMVDGRRLALGGYETELEAAHAYDRAAAKHFGSFARLNNGNSSPEELARVETQK